MRYALLVAALAACDGSHQSACVPGASSPCTCTDGRSGAQLCGPDGTFGACMCTGGGQADAAPTPPTADAAPPDAVPPEPDAGPCTTTVSGAVDLVGAPAAGVSVTLDPGGYRTTSAADGTYALACPPPGAYTISFASSGTGDATAIDAVTGTNGVIVDESGGLYVNGTIDLARGKRVANGRVTEPISRTPDGQCVIVQTTNAVSAVQLDGSSGVTVAGTLLLATNTAIIVASPGGSGVVAQPIPGGPTRTLTTLAPTSAVSVSADGRTIAFTAGTSDLIIASLATGNVLDLSISGLVAAAVVSPDGSEVAFWSTLGDTISVADAATGAITSIGSSPYDATTPPFAGPGIAWIDAAGVLHFRTGGATTDITGTDAYEVSPDGKYLAFASLLDGNLDTFDTGTQAINVLAPALGGSDTYLLRGFSPDGAHFLWMTTAGPRLEASLSDGGPIVDLGGAHDHEQVVMFSKDATRVATIGGYGYGATIDDLTTGTIIDTSTAIRPVFSPDLKRLIEDTPRIAVWDDAQPTTPIYGDVADFLSLEVSDDGKTFVYTTNSRLFGATVSAGAISATPLAPKILPGTQVLTPDGSEVAYIAGTTQYAAATDGSATSALLDGGLGQPALWVSGVLWASRDEAPPPYTFQLGAYRLVP
jgi:hypothetical protein